MLVHSFSLIFQDKLYVHISHAGCFWNCVFLNGEKSICIIYSIFALIEITRFYEFEYSIYIFEINYKLKLKLSQNYHDSKNLWGHGRKVYHGPFYYLWEHSLSTMLVVVFGATRYSQKKKEEKREGRKCEKKENGVDKERIKEENKNG